MQVISCPQEPEPADEQHNNEQHNVLLHIQCTAQTREMSTTIHIINSRNTKRAQSRYRVGYCGGYRYGCGGGHTDLDAAYYCSSDESSQPSSTLLDQ